MINNDRPVSDVVQDIVRNIQEIIRSEVRLAKTEVREEVGHAKSAGIVVAAGAVAAIFAVLFLLWAVVYALATAMPQWAAALIIGVLLGIGAGLTLNAGVKRFKQVKPTPQRTIASLKENVQWAKQQTR